MRILSAALCVMAIAAPAAVYAVAPAASVYLEDLTWTEVKDRMQRGADTIIIPTGGTEQNGPHIVIGKHNRIVHYTSGEIAKQLGNALVAPVIAYTPEGAVESSGSHMAFPGTITTREEGFAMVLEDAARSFKRHGFKHICFIGDSGGQQEAQAQLASRLTKEWKSEGITVLQVSDYYADKDAERWAREQKFSDDPLAHAGFADTSEVMAISKGNVRADHIKSYSGKDFKDNGVMGDPSKASAAHGKTLLEFKVKAAVQQIRSTLTKPAATKP